MRGVWNTTLAVSGAGSIPGSSTFHAGSSGRKPTPAAPIQSRFRVRFVDGLHSQTGSYVKTQDGII